MLYEGVIAKPTQKNVIRFSPPLVMTEAQLNEASSLIEKAWRNTN
jgi:ornithine--oxo-acid transaminase